MNQRALFILTGVFDDAYQKTREDSPISCTSAGKRIILYKAIQEASGSKLILLSPSPRGTKTPYSIEETKTTFHGITQYFSKASRRRKIRFLIDIINYAKFVRLHVGYNSVLIIDNYELIYVIACWYCRFCGLKNTIILEYEDGKHLIDKGIWKFFSDLAEKLGRPLIQGVIAATPTLLARLPKGIPSIVIPGTLRSDRPSPTIPGPNEAIRIIYSGSLDHERGTPLLVDYLESNLLHPKAEFHITGQGHFVDRIQELTKKSPKQIFFHGMLPRNELDQLQSSCHYGLNIQNSSNPVSHVTYPSKTFDYANAGLRLITTRTAGVDLIFGDEAIYINDDTKKSFSEAIDLALIKIHGLLNGTKASNLINYTYEENIRKLKTFLSDIL